MGKVKAYLQRALQLDPSKTLVFTKTKLKPSLQRESKNTLYHIKSHPLIPYTINPIPPVLDGGSCGPFGNKGYRGKASDIRQGLGLACLKIKHPLRQALI